MRIVRKNYINLINYVYRILSKKYIMDILCVKINIIFRKLIIAIPSIYILRNTFADLINILKIS